MSPLSWRHLMHADTLRARITVGLTGVLTVGLVGLAADTMPSGVPGQPNPSAPLPAACAAAREQVSLARAVLSAKPREEWSPLERSLMALYTTGSSAGR